MGKERAEAAAAQATKISVLNCIDLSNPDTNQSVDLLKQACTDSGFFYVVNHGISQDFMDEVFAQSKRLFALPHDQKMKLLRNEGELHDPQNQMHGDYKEGYYLGVEVDEDDPKSQKPQIYGLIQVTESRYSARVEGDYGKIPTEVGKAVARLVALALDLDANFFDKPEILGEPIAMMRLLRYEDRISDPSQGLFGGGAHTNYGLITLLATDDVPGLQIFKKRGAKPQIWENVAPMKGAYIVNIGDMLERWSNCVFKSTLHRVLGIGQERYSCYTATAISQSPVGSLLEVSNCRLHIAYFVEPGHDCLVECLPTCKSDSNPPKFPHVYYGDYLSQRDKDTHADLHMYKKQES